MEKVSSSLSLQRENASLKATVARLEKENARLKLLYKVEKQQREWTQGVLNNPTFTGSDKSLASAFKAYIPTRKTLDDGSASIYLPHFAEYANMSDDTAGKFLTKLEKAGVLEKENKISPDGKKHLFVRILPIFETPQEIELSNKKQGGARKVCKSCGSEELVRRTIITCKSCGSVQHDVTKDLPINEDQDIEALVAEREALLTEEEITAEHQELLATSPEYQQQIANIGIERAKREEAKAQERAEKLQEEENLLKYLSGASLEEEEEEEEDVPMWEAYEVKNELEPKPTPAPVPIRKKGLSRGLPPSMERQSKVIYTE